MPLAKIADIKVAPDRQRSAMNPTYIQELAASIEAVGLLHPIVVEDVPEGWSLLAGGCRLAAVTLIWEMGGSFGHAGKPLRRGEIPITHLADLTPLQRLEIELEENIRRENLSWQDQAAATARIASLKGELAHAEGREELSARALADEIGTTHRTLIQDLDLARNLADPDVAKAKTKQEALKVVQRKAQAEAHAKLAEAVGRTFESSRHRLFNADCLEWMRAAPPGEFDVIVTDPPYGMGADSFGDSGGMAAGAHDYEDSPDVLLALLAGGLCDLLFKMTKADAHCYLFCDIGWFPELRDRMADAGWRVFRTPLVWHKPNGMRAPWPECGPWRRYETILYALKGNRPTTALFPDVVTYPADTNLGHAAQKPVALYEDLLKRSALPGDSVFDPFCGSGPILDAATNLKLYATAIELSPISYGIALQRLQREGEQA